MIRIALLAIACSSLLLPAMGQNTVLILHDSVKIKTDLVSISEDQLFIKDGTLSLNEIYSVRFLNPSEASQRSVLVEKLLSKGILVYAGNELLVYQKPENVVSPNRSKENRPLPEEQQKYQEEELLSRASFGVGLGLDYGGIGVRFTFIPDPHVGIFGAGGFALVGFAYNVGAIVRFIPKKRFTPTASLMYGYNSAILVNGAPQYNKLYYGPSAGVGFQTKFRKDSGNYFHAELIAPSRSSAFYRDLRQLKSSTTISDPLPILISVGYHFAI